MTTGPKPDLLQEHVPLAPLTAYGVGGTAQYYLASTDRGTVEQAVRWARGEHLPVVVLGDGTNVLIADRGLPGLTVRWVARAVRLEPDGLIVADGGLELHRLVAWSLARDVVGLEWAAGIPGTTGAAVRGNVGAFGGDMGQCVVQAEILRLCLPCDVELWSNTDLAFEYRASRVKRDPSLVLRAWLDLPRAGANAVSAAKRAARKFLERRRQSQPVAARSCGCVFKNVTQPEAVVRLLVRWPAWRTRVTTEWHGSVPAAALVDAAGLKGLAHRGAVVSEAHANFILRRGDATAADIAELIRRIQRTIAAEFDVNLEPEIQLMGFET